MCNAYGQTTPISRLADTFYEHKLPLTWAEGRIPNAEPRELIRPTDAAPILRLLDREESAKGLRYSEVRWWLTPYFHKGPLKDWKALCTNARSETIDTTAAFREPYQRRRCLVPASHFFEWSPLDPAKPKGSKQKWRITAADADVFFFAGLWDRAHPSDLEGPMDSFAIATCSAGPDMAPIHHRQPVILDAVSGLEWLRLDGPGKGLLTPSAAGALKVSAAVDA